jgi:acetylornithine deacetylase/succinyl-diaminopimelate desuccinylase-like protein
MSTGSRSAAISRSLAALQNGEFARQLAQKVAVPSCSQEAGHADDLVKYLNTEIRPALEKMGYRCVVLKNSRSSSHPFLIADRIEDEDLPTILTYAHGDVIAGMENRWSEGLSPWQLIERDGRFYGRGTADNKGQHTIVLSALAAVLEERGFLGFNSRFIIETGEEVGSPGLDDICTAHADDLLQADIFIASDGPRISPERPTLFLGARGVEAIDLICHVRDGEFHSGNWGGLLCNPAIRLAHAIAAIVSERGEIRIPEWRPELPASVRHTLATVPIETGGNSPHIDLNWSEPELSLAEKVYGWNSFDVLSLIAGNPNNPVNAIPGVARAALSLRYVEGNDPDDIVPALNRHLMRHGFEDVHAIRSDRHEPSPATRLDPDDPWVDFVVRSLRKVTKMDPVVLPNIGGSLPNAAFAHTLGLKTIWLPHSYPGCYQHGPNEHIPLEIVRSGLVAMTAIFWDLGDPELEKPPLG